MFWRKSPLSTQSHEHWFGRLTSGAMCRLHWWPQKLPRCRSQVIYPDILVDISADHAANHLHIDVDRNDRSTGCRMQVGGGFNFIFISGYNIWHKLEWSGYKQCFQVGGGAYQLEVGGRFQEALCRCIVNIDLQFLWVNPSLVNCSWIKFLKFGQP